jgi:HEPN domain-containing protein
MENRFPQNIWPVVSQVAKSIVTSLSVEKVYLLAVVHQNEEIQSIFMESTLGINAVDSLSILVLTGPSEKRTNEELQDIIDHRLNIQIPVTSFVMHIGRFKEWLTKKHPFAVKIIRRAMLYYDTGNISLAIPDEYNELAEKEFLAKELDQKIIRAMEFLEGARLFQVRKQFELAAFHLHQAAEQIYTGIIRFTTGLPVHTHNLNKLYRYSKYLLPGLKGLFPGDTESERKLFQCLKNAYLGARYDTGYSIQYSGVSKLFQRIKKLLILCQGMRNSNLTTD